MVDKVISTNNEDDHTAIVCFWIMYYTGAEQLIYNATNSLTGVPWGDT